MITKPALALLSLTYRIASYINAVPYRWDPINLKLSHTTSKLCLSIFAFNVLSEWFYTAFKTVRLVYAYKNVSFFVVIIHAGWLSRDILLSAFYLTSIVKRNVVPEFFNKLLEYDQKLLPEFSRKQKLDHIPVGRDWCKMYHVNISFPVSASFPLFLALFGWVLASHPQFLSSLFSVGREHPPNEVKIVFLILEMWIGYTSFFSCYFYTCTLFCAIQSMRYSLRLLSEPPQNCVDYAESVTRSKKMYRMLQILNNYMNDCWRSIIAPVQQSVDLILGSTYTCGFLKYHHTMGMVTLFCFVYQVLAVAGCTSSTYSIAGRLPQWTERVFANWKRLELERLKKDLDGRDTTLTVQNEKRPLTPEKDDGSGVELMLSPRETESKSVDYKMGLGMMCLNNIAMHKVISNQRTAHARHMKVFLRSCKPLHMKTAFFFTVTKEYGLGWFSWYVENTVSLTLAFKDK